jgi:hypothetical protein
MSRRDEIHAIEREKIRQGCAVERPAGTAEMNVACDEKAIQAQVHGERIAGNGHAVACSQTNMAVGFNQIPVVVEIDVVRL